MNSLINISEDVFLSENIGRKSFKLSLTGNHTVADYLKDQSLNELTDICTRASFVYTKAPVRDIEMCQFLSSQSFYLVDTNFTLEKEREAGNSFFGNCKVREASPADKESVKTIAEKNFSSTRFHLDPNISNNSADNIKALWAENYFNGKRGDAMLVADVAGEIAGFLQLLRRDDNFIIDLIAVDSKFRRKGIAQDLMLTAENIFSDCSTVSVGTQLANTASIRCYEKAGFRYSNSSYVFHYYK